MSPPRTLTIPRRPADARVADGDWSHPAWATAAVAPIDQFHPAGSDHRPATEVRALYDDAHLYVRFDVADRYVVSTATRYQEPVCVDSCVEFFVSPRAGGGYFNFEFNAGGTMLLYHIEDPARRGEAFAKFAPVPVERAAAVEVYHSLPPVVSPERTDPTAWRIGARIPLALFAHYVGPVSPADGAVWHGNFYKCADRSSHPHWASWSPIGKRLDFHQPDKFGEIRFR